MNDLNFNIRIGKDLKGLIRKASELETLKPSQWARQTLKKRAELIISQSHANKAYIEPLHNATQEKERG